MRKRRTSQGPRSYRNRLDEAFIALVAMHAAHVVEAVIWAHLHVEQLTEGIGQVSIRLMPLILYCAANVLVIPFGAYFFRRYVHPRAQEYQKVVLAWVVGEYVLYSLLISSLSSGIGAPGIVSSTVQVLISLFLIDEVRVSRGGRRFLT